MMHTFGDLCGTTREARSGCGLHCLGRGPALKQIPLSASAVCSCTSCANVMAFTRWSPSCVRSSTWASTAAGSAEQWLPCPAGITRAAVPALANMERNVLFLPLNTKRSVFSHAASSQQGGRRTLGADSGSGNAGSSMDRGAEERCLPWASVHSAHVPVRDIYILICTTADSTAGGGTNSFLLTCNSTRASALSCVLAASLHQVLWPGTPASLSANSFCTSSVCDSMCGSCASSLRTSGLDIWYGMFATHMVAVLGHGATSASPSTILHLSPKPALATRSCSLVAISRSVSRANTRPDGPTASSSGRVRAPVPGPISSTLAPGYTCALRTILAAVAGDFSKCWPSPRFRIAPAAFAMVKYVVCMVPDSAVEEKL